MTTASNITAVHDATATDAKVGGASRQEWRFVRLVAPLARRYFKNKAAEHFAAMTGRHVRNAEKWLAGEVAPDGESMAKIMVSKIGPSVIEAYLANLPESEQRAFWTEIHQAYKRADRALRIAAIMREAENDRG